MDLSEVAAVDSFFAEDIVAQGVERDDYMVISGLKTGTFVSSGLWLPLIYFYPSVWFIWIVIFVLNYMIGKILISTAMGLGLKQGAAMVVSQPHRFFEVVNSEEQKAAAKKDMSAEEILKRSKDGEIH